MLDSCISWCLCRRVTFKLAILDSNHNQFGTAMGTASEALCLELDSATPKVTLVTPSLRACAQLGAIWMFASGVRWCDCTHVPLQWFYFLAHPPSTYLALADCVTAW